MTVYLNSSSDSIDIRGCTLFYYILAFLNRIYHDFNFDLIGDFIDGGEVFNGVYTQAGTFNPVLSLLRKSGVIPYNVAVTSSDPVNWDEAFDKIGFHFDDILKSYFDYVASVMLFGVDADDTGDEFWQKLPYRNLNFLPLYAYKRIVGDWYLNQLALPAGTPDGESWYNSQVNVDVLHGYQFDWSCANRQWANDYFTSGFPSPQAGQSVLIPVNGTMQDLRASNALIKFKERLMYAGKN